MDPRERWAENPFLVLGLAPTCTRADVEREGQKLLGLLGLGTSRGTTYDTPFGPRERTPDMVRAAMAALREPETRLPHEVWASVELVGEDEAPNEPAWPEALLAAGLRARR